MQTLKLQSDITAEFLAATEEQLAAIILQRLTERTNRMRMSFFQQKVVPWLAVIIRVLCVFLLIVTLPGFFMEESFCNSLTTNFFLSAFSAGMLWLFWDLKKLDAKLNVFNERTNAWAAKKHAKMILRQVNKLAPFQAEYDFRGDLVVYYRIKNDAALFAWSRKIKGFFIVGQGFTLLYKNEKAPYPYAVLFHESDELANYLIAQNCPQLTQ